MSESSCALCGRGFVQAAGRGRPRKYCSTDCHDEWARRRPFTFTPYVRKHQNCLNCGSALGYRANKFCSANCKGTYWLARRKCKDCGAQVSAGRSQCRPCDARKRKQAAVQRRVLVCVGCGIDYYNRCRNNTDGRKYCSRDCSVAAKCAAPYFSPVYERRCRCCGTVWVARGRSPKAYCSEKCRKELARRAAAETDFRARIAKRPAARQCVECDVSFTPIQHQNSEFCSYVCGQRKARRVGKARRKARILGLPHEAIDPIDVFAEDNWNCRACRCETPPHLRGTTSEYAPELDHIIPVSRNGPHLRDNVQTLCRQCNQLKGAMTMDEFHPPVEVVRARMDALQSGHGPSPR